MGRDTLEEREAHVFAAVQAVAEHQVVYPDGVPRITAVTDCLEILVKQMETWGRTVHRLARMDLYNKSH